MRPPPCARVHLAIKVHLTGAPSAACGPALVRLALQQLGIPDQAVSTALRSAEVSLAAVDPQPVRP